MSQQQQTEPSEVWVGLRVCGCPVAVVVHRDDFKDARKHTEEAKREFLRDGLSVIRVTWAQWLSDYSPWFLRDCGHNEVPAQSLKLPFPDPPEPPGTRLPVPERMR